MVALWFHLCVPYCRKQNNIAFHLSRLAIKYTFYLLLIYLISSFDSRALNFKFLAEAFHVNLNI